MRQNYVHNLNILIVFDMACCSAATAAREPWLIVAPIDHDSGTESYGGRPQAGQWSMHSSWALARDPSHPTPNLSSLPPSPRQHLSLLLWPRQAKQASKVLVPPTCKRLWLPVIFQYPLLSDFLSLLSARWYKTVPRLTAADSARRCHV